MADCTPESPRFDDGYDEDEVVMEVRLPNNKSEEELAVERVVQAVEVATDRRLTHSMPDRAARIRSLAGKAVRTQNVEELLAYLESSGWLNVRPSSDPPRARAYAMAHLRVDVELATLGRTSVWPKAQKRRVLVVRKRKRGPTSRARAHSD